MTLTFILLLFLMIFVFPWLRNPVFFTKLGIFFIGPALLGAILLKLFLSRESSPLFDGTKKLSPRFAMAWLSLAITFLLSMAYVADPSISFAKFVMGWTDVSGSTFQKLYWMMPVYILSFLGGLLSYNLETTWPRRKSILIFSFALVAALAATFRIRNLRYQDPASCFSLADNNFGSHSFVVSCLADVASAKRDLSPCEMHSQPERCYMALARDADSPFACAEFPSFAPYRNIFQVVCETERFPVEERENNDRSPDPFCSKLLADPNPYELVTAVCDRKDSDWKDPASGNTLLMFAIEWMKQDRQATRRFFRIDHNVDLLIAGSRNLNAKNNRGDTVLHLLVRGVREPRESNLQPLHPTEVEKLVSKILRAGADPDIPNLAGETPRTLAQQQGLKVFPDAGVVGH